MSSDSDFTGLAVRLRESGMLIVGMGVKTTPEPMIAACSAFKFLDIIDSGAKTDETTGSKKKGESESEKEPDSVSKDKEELVKHIKEIIDLNSDEEGWIMLSEIQSHIIKRKPEFDVRNYGFKKMLPLIESLKSFEVRKEKESTNPQNPDAHIVLISNKD